MSETDSTIATDSETRGRTVLVVDDEPSICWAFQRLLEEEGHTVMIASSAETGLETAQEHRPDLVLLDVRLPGEDGISALPKFSETTEGKPIVVMTAFGDLETAVSAVKQGASDYLIKPFRLEEAKRVCRRALSTPTTAAPRAPAVKPAVREHQLVGQSAAIQQAFRQIALVAASDLSVLITGETGTGKELVAAAIHRHSRRAEAPYLPIAPVALNQDLIESELFGHVKGAFTGAEQDRAGLFERAEGGTVLLDEIGDLPMNVQVKLLRVLEQGEYSRVGDIKPRRCDVRLLAATNCDLHQAMREGTFREDLFYRLSGMQIRLPPLRERREDVGLLCRHFLTMVGIDQVDAVLSEELIKRLEVRPWYGNIRELRNAVEHAAVIARGRPLTIGDFPEAQPGQAAGEDSEGGQVENAIAHWVGQRLRQGESDSLLSELLDVVEPVLLKRVLEQTAGNRARAAEILGIHRGTLREKLRQYDIG